MFIDENLFLQSMPGGDNNKVSVLKQVTEKVITERIQGEVFISSVPKRSEFKYLHEGVKKSRTNKDLKFTNHIGNTKAEYKKMCLGKLKADLNAVITSDGTLKPIDINKRFKSCLNLYVEEVEKKDTYLQSDIRDAAGGQIGVRVYFRLDLDKETSMPVYVIVLIDPHHLVFPTSYGKKSKEKVAEENYRNNAGRGHCMSKYL